MAPLISAPRRRRRRRSSWATSPASPACNPADARGSRPAARGSSSWAGPIRAWAPMWAPAGDEGGAHVAGAGGAAESFRRTHSGSGPGRWSWPAECRDGGVP